MNEKKIYEHILNLKEIKEIENDLKNQILDYPYCIGIDGATATGKTILANLLRKYLKKKLNIDSEIFQLDYLLLDRKVREKEVIDIKKNHINFSYEAENHMRFNKLHKLISKIINIKKSQENKEKLRINKLYSRKNNGTCSEEKVIDLSKKVLIFEGHYTSRNIISPILNKNYILFSNRKKILNRKINRSQTYRSSDNVIKYFDHIDLPSIRNNFLRFYKPNFYLINNNNFQYPKILNYENALKFLDQGNRKIEKKKKTLEYIFGSSSSNKKVFSLIRILLNKSSSNNIKFYLKKFNIKYVTYSYYTDYLNRENIYIFKEDNKKYFLIQNKKNKKQYILSFENGLFLIDDEKVFNLGISSFENLIIISNVKIEDKKFINSKKNIFEHFFDNKNKSKKYAFLTLLKSENDKFFLHDFFINSGWQTKFLDDFCFLAPNYIDQKFLEKSKYDLNLDYMCELNYSKKFNYEKKKNLYSTKNFYINSDYCQIKNKINKEIFTELKKLMLSKNYTIRKNTYDALLNYNFSSKSKIKKLIKSYLPLYPTSFSRLYAVNKILNIKTGILANNIYDLSDQSSDIIAYLKTSNNKKLPFILQSSLNAIGHEEKKGGKYNIGYLKAKDGPKSYLSSISKSIIYLNDKKKLKHLFYGIGLDHIDIKGDKPNGRSKRFLKKSLNTKSITHLTLDSSLLFDAKNDELKKLNKVYKKIFHHSNLLIKDTDFLNCDLEFCTGELNYFAEKNTFHYPTKHEIAMFEKIYNSSLDEIFYKNNFLNLFLKNKIKLYVGNLGTTHHGDDKDKNLKIDLGKEWNEANKHRNFISPVLHGTTNSKGILFKKASKHCLKINIAGTYLKVLFSNLDREIKKKIKFIKFDKNTKYLAYKLRDIPFEKKTKSTKLLGKKFEKYAHLNNYKDLKIKNLNEVRKSTFYLKNVSEMLLSDLKKLIEN